MPGLEQILAKRSWFVPEFTVWGLPGYVVTDFLVVELLGQTSTILFGSQDFGGAEQEVVFNQLVDHRGNNLPDSINSPMVLARSKGEAAPYIIGRETPAGFKIARPSDTTSPVQTDFFVVELGD